MVMLKNNRKAYKNMKKRSLSQKLFQTYAGWFLLCLVTFVFLAVWYAATVISQNIEDTQVRLMDSIDGNVENYFEDMNAFSMELLNSDEFKDIAIVQLPKAYEEKKSVSVLFSGMYLEAYKMIQNDYRIGVVADDKYYIWMGSNYYVSPLTQEKITTYDGMERNEKANIKYLVRNEYLKSTAGERCEKDVDKEYVTLSRSMDNQRKYLNGRSILEIMVDVRDLREHMTRLTGENHGLMMNLYDSDGNEIYRESNLDISDYVKKGEKGTYRQSSSRVDVHPVFDGKLTAVYVIDRMVYYKKLLSFLGLSVIVCLAACGIVMMITYKISKQISMPIHEMCRSVEKINLEQGISYEKVNSNIDELEFLSDSLSQMSTQLGMSLERIITLKDYETHAKMLALQAQMQPHFLFNTLTMIGTMAEEEGNEKIASICMNLTQMFRYIAAEDCKGVKMFEEIRHVERYVEIMKERFPETAAVIDIPLEELGCLIPKLTIQPLVENAFKYCNRKKPWICVKGSVTEDGRWQVEVQDNGNGFSRGKIREIMEKCRESMKEEKTLSNQIDGMGLVNVYIRLKLFYGDSMIYEIHEGTSRILIGGKVGES